MFGATCIVFTATERWKSLLQASGKRAGVPRRNEMQLPFGQCLPQDEDLSVGGSPFQPPGHAVSQIAEDVSIVMGPARG